MTGSLTVSSEYQLKWLHQEIDLFDRKLAHMDKFNPSATDAERSRMAKKRSTLEKTAREMAASGTQFKPQDLPRSFRPATDAVAVDQD